MQAVDELLDVWGVSGGELVCIPKWHYEDPELADGKFGGMMQLRDALLRCYDIR